MGDCVGTKSSARGAQPDWDESPSGEDRTF